MITTNRIAQVLAAQVVGNRDYSISSFLTDSRSLTFADQTLFFALRTERRDGAIYIDELYERGVRAFVVSKVSNPKNDAVYLVVENTLHALQKIAAYCRQQYNIPIIGITGSNGKTIVKEWLYQLLKNDYVICRSPRSYNSQIGVPLSVSLLNKNTTLGIFEAGISKVGEMQTLQQIIQPTIGVITNLGDAHQENFDSLEQKCDEKLKLFANSERIVYPKDDKIIDAKIKAQNFLHTISWGFSADADVRIVETTDQHIRFEYQGKQSVCLFRLSFVEDACICIATMLCLGYDADTIVERMKHLQPVAMRLEIREGHNGNLIINDTYSTDISSFRIALDTLDSQAEANKKQKTLIMSDILENTTDEQGLYMQVAKLCQTRDVNNVITVGRQTSKYLNLPNVRHYLSIDDLIASNYLQTLKDQVILLKGAHAFGFKRLVPILEKHLHQTVMEINLSALISNLNHFRSLLKPTTKLVSMVKANAYGMGAVEVSKVLQHHGADYLAVALCDEGVELRNQGIELPIIVMDPEEYAMDAMIAYHLEPNIYNFTILQQFANAVERNKINVYPIHIKIDSGMHRLGFDENNIPTLIDTLKHCPQVQVRSVFSHLAGSDDPNLDYFTLQQIETFKRCADQLSAAFDYKILHHILNSAGIERFTRYQFDMVRLGISHYGFSCLPDVKLTNVCTLKTIILQTKEVKAGESIGYNRKTYLKRDSKIGVIPIGYADGLDRRLSNGVGEVLVNGKRCKIMGNICMDQAMIDITDVEAHQGDEVIVFGDGLPIEEIAAKLNTITYEILTSVSPRVARIYFEE